VDVTTWLGSPSTSKDVAAALFLSPSTVEFHLTRIYRKLGFSSRAEVIHRFAASTEAVLEPAS
jgi:LuxR family transcriptional regulator, maltose regulon positive regulatory protein